MHRAQHQSGDDLLNQAEVSGKLRIDKRTLSRWRSEGIGPEYIRLGKSAVRYQRSVVDDWLENSKKTNINRAVSEELSSEDPHDDIHAPSHYVEGREIEPIDVIMDWFPDDYLLGTIQKYLSRVGRKQDPIKDLEKARFYLDRKIALLKCERDRRTMPFDLPYPDQ